MIITQPLSRRVFLRGLGTLLALPSLESFGAAASPVATAASVSGLPQRMAFLYIPNGVNVDQWMPGGSGQDYQLSPSLQALGDLKDKFSVISGLAHKCATNGGDGGGDHARAGATFLTGCRAKKTAGADIQIGVSVDQIAAEKLGQNTRLPSLELSTNGARSSGQCDSGYSCAYQYNLSWKSPTTPMAPEMSPRAVFERLFSAGDPGETAQTRAKRQVYNQSILDYVREDAAALSQKVSGADKNKIDEYLTAVRETELRLAKAGKFRAERPDFKAPEEGIPPTYQEHIRIMFDLLTMAFQTDSTRVATFLLAHDGSTRSFSEIGVAEGHHDLSHHQNNPEKLVKIAKIDQFYIEQLAYFLQKLRDTKEGESNLLEQSMIVYGGGISDGNRHNHMNLPVILAGGGGGRLQPGRHIRVPEMTPMTNLYLSMLDRMGVQSDHIGDSTGRLEQI